MVDIDAIPAKQWLVLGSSSVEGRLVSQTNYNTMVDEKVLLLYPTYGTLVSERSKLPSFVVKMGTPPVRVALVGTARCSACYFHPKPSFKLSARREEEMWRWFLGLASVPGVIVLVAYCFLPESPRFLSVVGRHDEAVKVCGGLYPLLRHATVERARSTSSKASKWLQW